ncbi:alanine or glycine:cation symporter, AGCS family [Peptoclostridium litorale DSM 5388]|uniref:Sodium/glycine symporter GlyP n=1 Tax=Peptoclostridium litorale DSM 5388 TaxID=1121324 RepID=A0A069RKX6_PEPLI|nr:sodium:alanine symporter family protein [Peptoclostridium litorale]KDR94882.1 sodium/glycine symporter GlyP [Peptoclostridium litorale DSM 5388]SIN94809.1 alanine or glycine:cation symporter, AGCS family [Peptoclostridium litorale DSM 5388]
MENLNAIVGQISGFLWGWPLIICLLGTHIFLTFRLRFIQRYIGKAIKLSVTKDEMSSGDVSQFAALATALAATIGTGNIVGVATAISIGGPGAVLWTWLTGVFGISTKYAEGLLAVKYRVRTKDGTMAGGPMYVIEHGMGKKWLAVMFALFTSIAAFGIGNMVQANSMAAMVNDTFGVPVWITGAISAVLVAAVIFGGVQSIAKVCNVLVPFMALFYVVGCLIILAMGYETIPASISLIFRSAFTGQAAMGGFVGSTMMMALRFGVARGLFSNESGLGSAPIVAAAAQTRNPVRQALVSGSATFWDTVIICAITGLVLTNTGAWQSGLNGGLVTKQAFETIPVIGPLVLTIGLVSFVFSTILGWSYYGEKAVEYLLGSGVTKAYRSLWVLFVFLGSIFSLDLVWNLSDLMNGLMALPNLISLLALSGVLVSETKKYLWDDNMDAVDETEAIVINK